MKKRLKVHARKEVIRSHSKCGLPEELKGGPNPFGIQYLVVVDFEATCEDPNPSDYIHEIIEFPAVLYNVNSKAVVNKCLSLFCTGNITL